MSNDRLRPNLWYRLFTKYVGEPQSRKEVYGFLLLLVGYFLPLIGILTFLFGSTGQMGDEAFAAREAAYALMALGLPVWLLGIVLILPVSPPGIMTAVFGVVVSVEAIWLFTLLYPAQWVIAGSSLIWIVIAVYAVGILFVAGIGTLVPVITGEEGVLVETLSPGIEGGQDIIILEIRGASIGGIPLTIAGILTIVLATVWPGPWAFPQHASLMGILLAITGGILIAMTYLLNYIQEDSTYT